MRMWGEVGPMAWALLSVRRVTKSPEVTMARPLPLFGLLLDSAELDGPENVRVFEDGRFLYGSFDYGREQVMDIRAHDRLDLLDYWVQWMRPLREATRRHIRTPALPSRETAQELEDPPGEFLTSLGKPPLTRG